MNLISIISAIKNKVSSGTGNSIESKVEGAEVTTPSILPLKYKITIVSVSLASAFAAGRWTVPEKVKIEKQIVEVEKKTKDEDEKTDKNKHVEIKTVEVTKPDGEKEVTTTKVVDTSSSKDVALKETKTEDIKETDKETRETASKVTISALVGGNFNAFGNPGINPLLYGASITKPVIGPFTIGVWGLSNATGGVSVGLTF